MKKLTKSVLAVVLSSSFAVLSAQEKKSDSIKTKDIDVVRIVGYRKTSKRTSVSSVTTVDSKAIENKANANVLNAVQGKVPGVNIAASSGQPGSKPSVIIRGAGTLSGNTDPLYVIDGFPSNSDGFRAINPNDIATFDVLKDVAAVSEYGSRGANGVIVITTKSGNYRSKTSFRYTTTTGIATLQVPKYNHANAQELLTIEKRKGVGLGATLTDAEIANYPVDTNWRNVFFRPALSTSHDFAVSSGSRNVSTYTSVGYLNQEGILRQTGLQRFTLRSNIKGRSDNKKFNYSVVTGAGFTKNNLATNLGSGAVNRNFVLGAYVSAPYVDPNLYTGGKELLDLYRDSGGTLLYTPLMLIDRFYNFKNYTNELRLDVTSNVSYEFLPGLEGRVRTSGQFLNTRNLRSEYPTSFNAYLFLGKKQYGGRESMSSRREFNFNNLWQLSYEKKVNDHTFTVTGNAEYTHSLLNSQGFTQDGLNPKTFVPGTGSGYVEDISINPDGTPNDDYVPSIFATELQFSIISYFGAFEYDFNKKLGLVATVRHDGSSVFSKDNRWGSFWSVGARWNLDRENFLKDVKFINTLKLRGSYGTVGNQRIVDGTVYEPVSPPLYRDVYGLSDNVYNGQQGYGINFGYADLRWEPTTQYNVGLDFRLFKRLSGTFDYYNRRTNDMFLPEPVSPGFGDTTITKNSDAYVINKGFELGLNYDIIRKRDFKLSINANGSLNNQVVGGIKDNGGEIRNTNTTTRNGGLMYEYIVYKYAGVNQSNGNLLFYDKDGNVTENPVEEDRVLLGVNYLPKYQGGFGFDLEYKGIFASAAFTFVSKIMRYDYDLSSLYDSDSLGQFNASSDLLNAWTPSNTNTNIPSLNATNLGLGTQSDRFIRDASYIRLRNVQIGYSLPKSLLSGTFIQSASINLQGENLVNFTKWRGFDPESSRSADQYQYPTPRIFSVGLDVKF